MLPSKRAWGLLRVLQQCTLLPSSFPQYASSELCREGDQRSSARANPSMQGEVPAFLFVPQARLSSMQRDQRLFSSMHSWAFCLSLCLKGLHSSKGLRASSCSLVRHNHFRRFKIRPGSEDDCHGKPKAKGSCLLVSCSDTPRRSRLPSIFLVEEYGWPTNSFLSGPHDLVCPQGWRLSIRSANHTPSDPRQAQRLGSGDP